MNSRRVHELMQSSFPAYNAVEHEWTNIAGVAGPSVESLQLMLERHFTSQEVLVEISRKEGAFLPVEKAISYIASHVGQGNIRVADRKFKSFLVVAVNGVATGWQTGG